MSHTLMSLDAEWRRLARTSSARRALKQWSIAHPALRGLSDLDALLERRRDNHAARAILRALAVLAPSDDLVARTLLQALLPGLIRLAGMVGYDDPASIEEMVSLTGTHPHLPGRRGSVAANVLFDVRKRYRAHRRIEAPRSPDAEEIEVAATSRSPEDEALARVLFEQLMAAQRNERVVRDGALGLVLRTCLAGEPLTRSPGGRSCPCPCLPNAAGAPSAACGNCPWPGDSHRARRTR